MASLSRRSSACSHRPAVTPVRVLRAVALIGSPSDGIDGAAGGLSITADDRLPRNRLRPAVLSAVSARTIVARGRQIAPLSAQPKRNLPRGPPSANHVSQVQELLDVGAGDSYDEPRSSPRVHNARVRLRHRPLPRSCHQSRDYVRRGEGTKLRSERTPTESHAAVGSIWRGGSKRKSVITVPLRNRSIEEELN